MGRNCIFLELCHSWFGFSKRHLSSRDVTQPTEAETHRDTDDRDSEHKLRKRWRLVSDILKKQKKEKRKNQIPVCAKMPCEHRDASGALLPDALAGAAHLPVQFDHLQHGFLPAPAQVVEQTLVLFREPVEHTEDVTWRGDGGVSSICLR